MKQEEFIYNSIFKACIENGVLDAAADIYMQKKVLKDIKRTTSKKYIQWLLNK